MLYIERCRNRFLTNDVLRGVEVSVVVFEKNWKTLWSCIFGCNFGTAGGKGKNIMSFFVGDEMSFDLVADWVRYSEYDPRYVALKYCEVRFFFLMK